MQGVDQIINGGQAVLFGDVGQVSVTCGGGGTGMAENRLNMAQTQALFEQMGGKTMTQGVNRDFFLMPHSRTTVFIAT